MVYRFLIWGKVQGVGFRKYIKSIADKYKLNGWTRNLSDGRVEAMIEIQSEMLDEICALIKKGPSRSEVEKMLVENVSYNIDNIGFVIAKDA